MLSSDYHQMSRGISQGNQAIRKPHLIDSGKECVHTPYLRLYRRQRSSRLSVMAPPAEFSYGPTDPDADARYAARGRHGVQFPQCQLDQWKAVLPGINWIQVHGEEGLTRGACCRLVAMAAWSPALPRDPAGRRHSLLPVKHFLSSWAALCAFAVLCCVLSRVSFV